HIYAVLLDEKKKEIPLDAVLGYYDHEKKPKAFYDMALYKLSGTADPGEGESAGRARLLGVPWRGGRTERAVYWGSALRDGQGRPSALAWRTLKRTSRQRRRQPSLELGLHAFGRS
ncbi:MAG: hypothetical protein ACK5IH_02970, partial [Betaproteobacteria bacterium]